MSHALGRGLDTSGIDHSWIVFARLCSLVLVSSGCSIHGNSINFITSLYQSVDVSCYLYTYVSVFNSFSNGGLPVNNEDDSDDSKDDDSDNHWNNNNGILYDDDDNTWLWIRNLFFITGMFFRRYFVLRHSLLITTVTMNRLLDETFYDIAIYISINVNNHKFERKNERQDT